MTHLPHCPKLQMDAEAIGDRETLIAVATSMLPYIYPRRKSVEVAADTAPVQFNITTGGSPLKLSDSLQIIADAAGEMPEDAPEPEPARTVDLDPPPVLVHNESGFEKKPPDNNDFFNRKLN